MPKVRLLQIQGLTRDMNSMIRQKKAPNYGAFLNTNCVLTVADVHSYFETETHI